MDYFHLFTKLFAFCNNTEKFFKTFKTVTAQPLIILVYVIGISSSRIVLHFFTSEGMLGIQDFAQCSTVNINTLTLIFWFLKAY